MSDVHPHFQVERVSAEFASPVGRSQDQGGIPSSAEEVDLDSGLLSLRDVMCQLVSQQQMSQSRHPRRACLPPMLPSVAEVDDEDLGGADGVARPLNLVPHFILTPPQT